MKTATGETSLDVWANCPYCDEYQDVIDETREYLGSDLRVEDEEIEITCVNRKCKEQFLITRITY